MLDLPHQVSVQAPDGYGAGIGDVGEGHLARALGVGLQSTRVLPAVRVVVVRKGTSAFQTPVCLRRRLHTGDGGSYLHRRSAGTR